MAVKLTTPPGSSDLRFLVKARSLEDLFSQAGSEITKIQIDPKKIKEEKIKKISLQEKDLTSLFYTFLSELVFLKDSQLFFGKNFLLKIKRKKDRGWVLEGIIKGDSLKPDEKISRADIKGIAYHQLEVKKTNRHWQAQVVVDL